MGDKKTYVWWVEKQIWIGEEPPQNARLRLVKVEEGDWTTGNYEVYEVCEDGT